MRDDLDRALCTKYPEIFRNRHGPMSETAMCWGFECSDYWYPLLDRCCALIMHEVKSLRRDVGYCQERLAKQATGEEPVSNFYDEARLAKLQSRLEAAVAALPVASQVKEKFGGLRFYVDGGTDEHQAYIRFAELMSHRICEECGTTATTQTWYMRWYRTLCKPCAIKHYGQEDVDLYDPGENLE